MINLKVLLGCSLFIGTGMSHANSLEKTKTTYIVGGTSLGPNNPGSYSTVNVGGFCTGTVVAENLVITAAHCLQASSGPVNIYFTDSIYAVSSANTRTSYEYQINPKYRSRMHDIAWMKFDGGLPHDYEPVPILSRDAMKDIRPSSTLTLVGFGAPSEYEPPTGYKLTVETTFAKNYDGLWYRGFFVTGPTPNRGGCYGDSGGPAYINQNGDWFVIGAVHGPDSVRTKARICEEGAGLFTSIGYNENWIESSSGVRLTNEKELSIGPVNPGPDPIDPGEIIIDPTDPTPDPIDPGEIIITPDPIDPGEIIITPDPIDPGEIIITPDPINPGEIIITPDPIDPGEIIIPDPTDPGNIIVTPYPTDPEPVDPTNLSGATASGFIKVDSFSVSGKIVTVKGALPKETTRLAITGSVGTDLMVLAEYLVENTYLFSLSFDIPDDSKKTVSVTAYDKDGVVLDSRFYFVK